ncbi:MAG: C4-dicarboxylate TRAP transporter substrate-binding protein [Pseudomonadota bacterium]
MLKATLLGAVSALTLYATAAAAGETLTITSWTGEKHPFSVDYADFVERVARNSEGRVDFDLYVGGALLPPNAVLAGIRDGVADIGNNVGAYTPADLPINNLLNDVSFASSNSVAAGIAMTEMTLMNQAARAEWEDHGVVFINGWSTPVYYLACTQDVRTFADLDGLKIRTAGGAHVEWAKSANGIPVSVPFSDVYSGLQRGSIDCVMMNASDMGEGFQIAEVADNYTLLPLGTHTSGVQYMFNKDAWADLPTEDRNMLLRELARQLVRFQLRYEVLSAEGMQAAIDQGVDIREPDPSMVESLAAFKEAYYASLPQTTEEKRGIPAAQAKVLMEEYAALYNKWQSLLEGIDVTDEEAVLALVEQEIYSKLDPKTFGL